MANEFWHEKLLRINLTLDDAYQHLYRMADRHEAIACLNKLLDAQNQLTALIASVSSTLAKTQ